MHEAPPTGRGGASSPAEFVARLNAEINRAIGSDEMKRFLEGEGAEGSAMSAKAFRELIEREVKPLGQGRERRQHPRRLTTRVLGKDPRLVTVIWQH